ncbi:MAG: response regulator [Deltaproteobacteria bacterium]|nr:response regulator [Deltaproteobacteria bacterium]
MAAEQGNSKPKKPKQDLKKSDSMLKAIFTAIPDLLTVHDRDLNIVVSNFHGHEYFDEKTGHQGAKCYSVYMRRDTPCDPCHALEVFETGKPKRLEKTNPVDGITREINVYPIFDESGQVSMVAEHICDITERKQAEQKLCESEERLRAVFEANPDLLFVLDRENRFVDCKAGNTEELYVPREQAIGKKVAELLPPQVAEKILAAIDKVRATDKIQTCGYTLEVSGVTGHFEARIVKCGAEHVLAIVRNVTEIKQAEEKRLELERQILHTQKLESLGVLAGGIAHDFNNLLMGVLGNASLALADLPPESPVVDYLKDVEKAGQRAADLARQMLAYSGKGLFKVEKIDLQLLVEEMGHLLEISMSKKAVIRYDFAANVLAVEADASQLRQVIMNMITNASDAIGDKSGVIAISIGSIECDSEYLDVTYLDDNLSPGIYSYIEVSDSGIGMDAETINRVFDPFFTTKFTGRGLGMAAVLGIVRGHKGAIKIYSEPGKGTTFKVLLPAVTGKAMSAEPELEGIEDWQTSGTVLLVDDEETIQVVARRMLEHLGLTVLTAGHGRQALEIFTEQADKIDCVLLDLTMPYMDGEECFRELRRIKKDVKVILTSGYNEHDLISRFAGKGLAGFIQKPYRFRKLIGQLKKVLD